MGFEIMPEFVFQPPPPVSVPVADGRLFPVRRIFCVGRNYAAHAREMGNDPNREPPFFFHQTGGCLGAARAKHALSQ